MRFVGVVVIALMALSSCNPSKKDGVTINVKFGEELAENGAVVLYQLDNEGLTPIDTFDVVDTKNYTITYPMMEGVFYHVNAARRKMANLVMNGDESEISIDFSDELAKISGSELSGLFVQLDSVRMKFSKDTYMLQNDLNVAATAGNMQAVEEIQDQYVYLENKHFDDIQSIIEEADGSLVALYGLNFMNPDADFDFIEKVVSKVAANYPDHMWVKEYQSSIEVMAKLAIGRPAPDFSLPTPEGTELALSDLNGKYVLIDFWAAWCAPCRRENPNVVAAYKKYGGEKFEILGVSLDRTRDAWLKAIEDDGLVWKHVSDLEYYNSEAAMLYNIDAIPATYLIDPEGKIIAKNLRGQSLEAKLEELFGS